MATVNDVKKQIVTRNVRPMSPAVAEVRTNINIMVEVMKSCMVKDMHFGIIPGVQKPSLFKAGAEKIMATFRLSANPIVEDLSKNGELRFRVRVEINAKDGSFVGAGVGECSSEEEKYMWRAAVCQKEFEMTPDNKRRIKFKKSYGNIDEIEQVRCNPSDLANTILKMAKKRALVDGVLTATGASDLFSQDIEDLPAEYIQSQYPNAEVVTPAAQEVPVKQVETAQEAPKEEETAVDIVSEHASIKTAAVGSIVEKFTGLVNAIKTRKTKTGKDVSVYMAEDTDGIEYIIEKWGTIHKGIEPGVLARFSSISVSEFQGKKQYMAKSIELEA